MVFSNEEYPTELRVYMMPREDIKLIDPAQYEIEHTIDLGWLHWYEHMVTGWDII